MINFFYSDPHYGHKNIIEYANRPFVNIHHMDKHLQQTYCSVVGEDDTVWWLGDCTFRFDTFAEILRNLPGQKVLVRGNHDKSARKMQSIGFDMVMEGPVRVTIAGVPCVLSHYPPAKAKYIGREHDGRYADRRPRPESGEVVIHGHTHEHIQVAPGRVHVGVDACGFSPISYTSVESLVQRASH